MASTSIFVRQKQTLKFFGKHGQWVSSFLEAKTFTSTWEAVDSCAKHRVHGAEIVMRMGEPLYDILIDIP
ncbi:MAG: hypothetical protein JWR19_3517 [Pedosphaera sp.]|nr:hypothetical protein [Pedosphaera sp.]